MTEIETDQMGSALDQTQLCSEDIVSSFPGTVNRTEKLPDLKVRDDDILIISLPRSGTNWVEDIVTMLIAGSTTIPASLNVQHMLEARDHVFFDEMTSPRVMNTHLYRALIPDSFVHGPCRKIIVRRNPKDSAVSGYNFLKNLDKYHGDWNDFIEMYQTGKRVVGDWKNYFTVAQNEEFDKIWEKEMSNCDLYTHLKKVSEN